MRTRGLQRAAASCVVATWFLAACKPVEVIDAPDSGIRECKAGTYVFCDAAAPGDPSCKRQDPVYKRLVDLGPGPNLPAGCTVNFVDGRDVNGECKLAALCRCQEPDVNDASAWTCFP